jgi:hypothetical protein
MYAVRIERVVRAKKVKEHTTVSTARLLLPGVRMIIGESPIGWSKIFGWSGIAAQYTLCHLRAKEQSPDVSDPSVLAGLFLRPGDFYRPS